MNRGTLRLTLTLIILIILTLDYYSPIFLDESLVYNIPGFPEIKKLELTPKNIEEYTLDNPGKAIILYSNYFEQENSIKNFNTQITYKNIYEQNIKINKIILSSCEETYYEFKQIVKENGRVNTTIINENSTIEIKKEFILNPKLPLKKNLFKKIELTIDYTSFLNLTPIYIPTKDRSYICTFNLYDENNKQLYSIKSNRISNNFDNINFIYMNAMNNLN